MGRDRAPFSKLDCKKQCDSWMDNLYSMGDMEAELLPALS